MAKKRRKQKKGKPPGPSSLKDAKACIWKTKDHEDRIEPIDKPTI